jgi:hypothetical protein
VTAQQQREMEWLAAFVHGMLAVLHALAAVWNWLRSKKVLDPDALVHTAAFTYDVLAARKHAKRVM